MMPVRHASLNTVPQVISDAVWTVSHNKQFIIAWGSPSTLEISTKLADYRPSRFSSNVGR